MEQFENVSIIKKANIYFEGNVTSRTIIFKSGEKKTIGIMLPGEYEFKTGKKELMEIQAGNLHVLIDGDNEWKSFSLGESFEVPANSSFKVKVKEISDYCCSYIE